MSPMTAVQLAADAYERARARQEPPVKAMEDALVALRSHQSAKNLVGLAPHVVAVLDAALRARGVTLKQARRHGKSTAWVGLARTEAIRIVRAKCPEVSWDDLGRFFGRDRTGLLSADRKLTARLQHDDILARRMAQIVGEGQVAA